MAKQLSGVDASFLYMETGSSFGHVAGLAVFKRPEGDPGWSPYDILHAKLARRLGDLEPFRRRLVEVPLQLDHPFWVEDPDFDMEFHLRESALPSPGSDSQLAQLVARLVGRAMDRAHPLWEIYVIEGLTDDRFAVLTKLHHATIDGAAGAELMKIFYDDEPGVALSGPETEVPRASPLPSPAQALGWALAGVVRKPGKFVRLQVRAVRAFGELTRNQGLTGLADLARTIPNPIGARVAARSDSTSDAPPAPPENAAPATPFNGSITPHRRVALRSIALEDVKAIKNAAGATVNDVIMAACSGALREFLARREALPDTALVAMVPVSIRTGSETDPWTNRVSAMFAVLPTTAADPLDRLRHVQKTMNEAKGRFALVPADVLTDYAEFAPPALFIRAARVASRLRLADRFRPPFNLVISNVPGPRSTLWLDTAEMVHYFPISTIAESQGLNITVQSYRDTMDVGLVACRELVPDLEVLADLLLDEIAALGAAAGVERAAPSAQRVPSPPSKGRAARV
jgi:diacylglycerol O-acyltransferase